MPEGASETLGNLISRYRGYKHWTQRKLAQEMGRSISWVTHVERDEIEIKTIDALARLAEVLEIPRDELVEARMGPEKGKSLRGPEPHCRGPSSISRTSCPTTFQCRSKDRQNHC